MGVNFFGIIEGGWGMYRWIGDIGIIWKRNFFGGWYGRELVEGGGW